MGGAKMRIEAFLCLLGLRLTATLAAPMPSNKLETNRGLVKHCQAGKMHTLRYETVGELGENRGLGWHTGRQGQRRHLRYGRYTARPEFQAPGRCDGVVVPLPRLSDW